MRISPFLTDVFRTSTKELAELLQKYACHGEKIIFPDDDQMRQNLCNDHLDTLARCTMDIKNRIKSLQMDFDVLKELHKDAKSKLAQEVIEEEWDALEEEIRFFETIFDAQRILYRLQDRMANDMLVLARLGKGNKFFNAEFKKCMEALNTHTMQLREDIQNAKSPIEDLKSIQKKQQQNSKKAQMLTFDGKKDEIKELHKKDFTGLKQKTNTDGNRNYVEHQPFSTIETPLQGQVVTSMVPRAKLVTASFRSKGRSAVQTQPTVVEYAENGKQHVASYSYLFTFSYLPISLYSATAQPSTSDRHRLRSKMVDSYTAIRSTHQIPLLDPDKWKLCHDVDYLICSSVLFFCSSDPNGWTECADNIGTFFVVY